MSVENPELREFVRVVTAVVSQGMAAGDSGIEGHHDALVKALGEADVTDLAIETEGLEDSLDWLGATVAAVAKVSPSVAYGLAARYVAQRALRAAGVVAAEADVTAGLVSGDPGEATLQGLFPAKTAVLIDLDAHSVTTSDVPVAGLDPALVTGLRDAELGVLRLEEGARSALDTEVVDRTIRDLAVLVSAVSEGIAVAALEAAEAYAKDRRQFGAPIASFAGLRAILVQMRQRVADLQALLESARRTPEVTAALEAARGAGSAAVDVGLAAIQVHGGYGYIDEYPISPLVRDAISVSSRNIPNRVATAMIGARRLDEGIAR